ncbi:MAG: hypothetical protein PF541_10940 [Prolixibacteraceae bacterium]|nr:hypothetical protein [Prolixibacteraceae bacterium]
MKTILFTMYLIFAAIILCVQDTIYFQQSDCIVSDNEWYQDISMKMIICSL